MYQQTTIRTAVAADRQAWNGYLDSRVRSSPLARFEWQAILQDSYGVETRFLIAERGGQIVGALPCYINRGLRGRARLYSLRFGLVADDADIAAAFLDHVEDIRRRENLAGCIVTSGLDGFPERPPSSLKKTLLLALNDDDTAMWKGMRDKTRNMIRKAEKAGVSIVSGARHLDTLHDQYAANMARLGVPMHSKRFFQEVVHHLGDRTDILVAVSEGRAIASMMLHYGNAIACYPYQNSLFEYRKLAPIQVLNWAAMQRCGARGMSLLDMGESGEGSPVFKSKIHFGGVAHDVHYYSLPDDRRQSSGDPSSVPQMSGKSRLALLEQSVIRHLPAGLRKIALRAKHRGGRLL